MLRSEIEFASFLSYTKHGDDPEVQRSLIWRDQIKHDKFFGEPPKLTSRLVAERIAARILDLPFSDYFGLDVVLVPVPSSRKLQADSLWVPHRIATALVEVGLGRSVEALLERAVALQKSAWAPAHERASARDHYDSLKVTSLATACDRLVLVDDFVTRGATFLGAASRLAEAFPGAEVRCFAVTRSLSPPLEFTKIDDPVVGTIELKSNGGTVRRP